MKKIILVLLLFSFSTGAMAQKRAARAGGSGSHGGDGRIVLNPDENLIDKQGLENLNRLLQEYLVKLKTNRYRSDKNVAVDWPFDPILSTEYLEDVQHHNYMIYPNRGDCGFTKDNFPRVASTNAKPRDEICFDNLTIGDLRLTTVHLVGMLAHEHCHHVKSCSDAGHDIAKAVSATFEEIMRPDDIGWCALNSSQMELNRLLRLDERPVRYHQKQTFSVVELVKGQPQIGAMLGSRFAIQATEKRHIKYPGYELVMRFNDKIELPYSVSSNIIPSAQPYLKPIHFKFSHSMDGGSLFKEEKLICVVEPGIQ